jgi:hypothetical protein
VWVACFETAGDGIAESVTQELLGDYIVAVKLAIEVMNPTIRLTFRSQPGSGRAFFVPANKLARRSD